MKKFADDTSASIARKGGNVDMPPGITDQNEVIARIIRGGVPEAHSRQTEKWSNDEKDFVWCARKWKHSTIAAYLGRTEQASRLQRLHEADERRGGSRGSTQQDTQATQNDAQQLPSAVAGPSASSGPSGLPDPSSSSAATQELHQIAQMSIGDLSRWRSGSTPPSISPWDSELVERQDSKPVLMEPATRTTLDAQAAAIKDSAPASNAIMTFKPESGLDMLAIAAAQVGQGRASPCQPYDNALAVMGHDVGDHEMGDQEAEKHDVD